MLAESLGLRKVRSQNYTLCYWSLPLLHHPIGSCFENSQWIKRLHRNVCGEELYDAKSNRDRKCSHWMTMPIVQGLMCHHVLGSLLRMQSWETM